jgi:hypothetical protein
MRLAGHVERIGRREVRIGYWLGNPEEMRPLGRPRRRWVDNIKMELREIGWGGIDWIGLTQDRDQWWAHVNTVMNLRVSQNIWKFLSSCTTGYFSRRSEVHEVSWLFIMTSVYWSQ